MFTNTMDVDCSLEEFARVLAANGYINDDFCFVDTDVPSLLNGFDTSYVLGGPDNVHDNPYNNGDTPRTLEMAQVANQSLIESCLQASLADSTTRVHNVYPSKVQDACLGISVLHESVRNIPTSLSHRGSYCSNDVYIDNKVICNAVSLNMDSKQDTVIKPNNIHVNDHLLPHSVVSHLGDNGFRGLYRDDNTTYIKCHAAEHHDKVDLQDDCCHRNVVTVERDPLQSHPSGTKQKRKRRSKGYSKPAKSKKKKSKETITVKSQPRAKKQKLLPDSVDQEETGKEEINSCSESADILQDDSGFESGDKNVVHESSGSTVNETSESTSSNSESVNNSEESKSLRRSSRTTRKTENYNLRLSSLVKRVETERRQEEPRQHKDKTKPAPLSKYRRRTANARERDRMKEINDAFDNLKNSLPSIERDDGKIKVTKFTILKHALNYIASLRDVLSLETILPPHDDDMSSDFSSVRPGSVTSYGGEDSCSSPTSGHSMAQPNTNNHISSFCVSEIAEGPDQTQPMNMSH